MTSPIVIVLVLAILSPSLFAIADQTTSKDTTTHAQTHPTTKATAHHAQPHPTTKATAHHAQPHPTTKATAHHAQPHPTTKATAHHAQPHPTTKATAHHAQPHPTTKATAHHAQPHPTTKATAHHAQPHPTTKATAHHAQPHPTTKATAHHAQPHPTTKATAHHAQPHPTTKATAHHAQPHSTTKATAHHAQPHPTTKATAHHAQPHSTAKATAHHAQPHPTTKATAHHAQPQSTTKATAHHAQTHPTTKATAHHAHPHPTTKPTAHHAHPHPTTKPPAHHQHAHPHPTTKATSPPQLNHVVDELKKQVDYLEKVIGGMARQMMLQQLFVEERIRSDGDSGLKQIRYSASDGSRPYYTNTISSGAVAAIHEHANYDRTVGMGEFIAVMNGVEFRTRHNDYKLRMPSRTDKSYHKMVDIPFPDVPPSVLSKHTVAEQIAEMRKYFEAFHKQDRHIRNYEPYFKPAMCYLEGAWTMDTKTLSEPFHSDRHFIDASSWFDLQEKVRYTGYTGGKSNFENYSFLPTTIINVTEHGQPIYAQWNYRILCHPVKTSLKLQDFQLVDDLATRMRLRKNITQFGRSRAARFRIAGRHGSHYDPNLGYGKFTERNYGYGLLDRIMGEIPGKDNYPGNMEDKSFDLVKYRIDTKNNTKLNTAYYHRYYKVLRKGAMGLTVRHRGFADANLFVASTTQPRIAELGATDCVYNSHVHKRVCHDYKSRYTYAVPLEVVWLTPLSSWNPYKLYMHDYRHRSAVTAGGRNGGLDKAKAYNGTSMSAYYLTPAEFFHPGEVNRDPADTARDTVGVLDQQGNVRKMVATGTRIFLPEVPGVGILRQRYPIMPAHSEGSFTMKNLDALQDIMMQMKNFAYMFEDKPSIADSNAHPPDAHYLTSTTHDNPPGMHRHDVYLTVEQVNALHRNGTTVHVFTTHNNGHNHELILQRDGHRRDYNALKVVSCDGLSHCWDHHSGFVFIDKP